MSGSAAPSESSAPQFSAGQAEFSAGAHRHEHAGPPRATGASRTEMFLDTVDALQHARSVELVGRHGSGRTYLLTQVHDHFVRIGWRVIRVTGIEAFRRASLIALSLAGLAGRADGVTPPLIAAFEAVRDRVIPEHTILMVDDADSLDDASWGVIAAASSQLGVPYVAVRLRENRHRDLTHPRGGFHVVYTIDVGELDFAELEGMLSANLELHFDDSTMSRIYAMSGGNIGLATLIVDANRRAGRMQVDASSTARASGALWVPALKAIAETLLQPLSDEEFDALKAIALLGPTAIETVARVVSRGTLTLLEDRAVVSVVEVGGRQLVVLNPPLLSEYFKHVATQTQQAELLAKIDVVAQDDLPEILDVHPVQERAQYLRLVHERASRNTIQARQRWSAQRTIGNAIHFVQTMHEDPAHSSEELASVVESARALRGTDVELADWAVAYAEHLAYYEARLDDALVVLELAGEEIPTERIRLDAQLVLFRTSYLDVPDEEPFASVQLETLPEHVRLSVAMARLCWLVVRGRTLDAEALLASWATEHLPPAKLAAFATYALMANGKAEDALRLVDAGLASARAEFDARQIRRYSFLKSIALHSMRRHSEAEDVVVDAVGLGQPAGESPLSQVGLAVLGAYFADRRGQSVLVAEFIRELDAVGLPEGALPALNRAMFTIRAEAHSGNAERAADAAREAGDALWERGAYLTAAWTYLDGFSYAPRLQDWPHISARIAQVPCPLFDVPLRFIGALVSGDIHAVQEQIARLKSEGRLIDAQYAAQITHAAAGLLDAQRAEALRGVIDDAVRIVDRQRHTAQRTAELTAREREVAELIAAGLSNPQIAEALVVSIRTVESHINKLMKKIGARERSDVRQYLIREGLTQAWS